MAYLAGRGVERSEERALALSHKPVTARQLVGGAGGDLCVRSDR